MANVARAAAILACQIVRIPGKESAALAIRIPHTLAQEVTALDRELRVQPAVNEDEHLSLINPSTAFKLIDFTLSRNWTNTIRVGRRDRGRYRRVDVARTNHIQYPRGI